MVIPNEGKLTLIYWGFKSNGSDVRDFYLSGFQNDYTPVDDSTQTSFVESTFAGYAQIPLTRAACVTPVIIANESVIGWTPAPQWSCSGGAAQTLYGWFLRASFSNSVIAAQRFDTPRLMTIGVTEYLDPFLIRLRSLG